MTSSLEALCAHDIGTSFASFCCMFWVSAHVHVQNAVGMQFLDDMRRRNANGGHEQTSAALYDDINLFVEGAMCEVILLSLAMSQKTQRVVVLRLATHVGPARRSTHFRQKEINSERQRRIF
jgi:hypothetical protein